MQRAVETDLKTLSKIAHVEKQEEVGEDIILSPVIVTRKSEGSVKIALDAEKLNRKNYADAHSCRTSGSNFHKDKRR